MDSRSSRSGTLAEDKEMETSATPSIRKSLDKETQDKYNETATKTEKDEEASLRDVAPADALAEEEDDGEYPTGLPMTFIVLALVLSIFLVALDMTIVATAIPKITDEFQELDAIGWYGSAFFLTVASFQSTWGKAYKYFPLKITFLSSVFVFELGSLICGVAPNSTALIVGRAIAGVGGAGIASGCYTLIAFAARPSRRAAFTGIVGASYGVASVVGPLLGGVFAEKATWRWCFYINLPIGGIAGGMLLLFFHAPARAAPVKATLKEKLLQMDLPGAFTVMAAVVCYILALQWGGQEKRWSSSDVIGTLVGFVLIFLVFFVIEYYQGERAMIVGRLLKDRTVSVGMAYIFFLAGGFFTLLYYIPIYFQVVSDVSASQSGVRNLPLIIGCTITTILSGGLISAYGHFVPFMILGSVGGTIGSGLLYTLSTTSSSSQWIGYQALAGLGIGLSMQIPVISAQAVVAPSDLASATAMVLFCQTIGGAFFVSAGQSAFINVMLQRLPTHAPNVDVSKLLITGVTELRDVFPAEDIPGIVDSYMGGLKVAYAVAIAATGISVIISLASKWRNLKGKVVAGGAA